MRLIDAEALVKEMCNNCDGWCEDTKCDCLNCKKTECRWNFLNELMDAPNVDAVSVVRCRECKYHNKPRLGFCEMHLVRTNGNDFCSYGEHKGGVKDEG